VSSTGNLYIDFDLTVSPDNGFYYEGLFELKLADSTQCVNYRIPVSAPPKNLGYKEWKWEHMPPPYMPSIGKT
jgi:hypothetical protein